MTARVGEPVTIEAWARDDGKVSGIAAMFVAQSGATPPIDLTWFRIRGPVPCHSISKRPKYRQLAVRSPQRSPSVNREIICSGPTDRPRWPGDGRALAVLLDQQLH